MNLEVLPKKFCFIPKKHRFVPHGRGLFLFPDFAVFRQSLRNMRKGIFSLRGGLNVVSSVFVYHVKRVLRLAHDRVGARGGAVVVFGFITFIFVHFKFILSDRNAVPLHLLLFPPAAEKFYSFTKI